jgi:RNA polymerase sigma factor (sigma-70 family)
MPDHRPTAGHTSRQRRAERMREREQADFLGAVHAELVRLLGRRCSAFDADDIAQAVCERLWKRIGFLMERYPSAVVLAGAVLHNAVIDYRRTQNSQRGHGAHALALADGTMSVKRIVVSGDALVGESGSPLWELLVDEGESFADRTVAMLDAAFDAAQVLVGLPRVDVDIARLLADGFTQGEVAERLGLARETVNRRWRQMQRSAQAFAASRSGGE